MSQSPPSIHMYQAFSFAHLHHTSPLTDAGVQALLVSSPMKGQQQAPGSAGHMAHAW